MPGGQMPDNKPAVAPYAALGVGIAAISCAAILIRHATAPPLVIAAYRMAFTVLFLAPVATMARDTGIFRLSRRDLAWAAAGGVLLALHFITWITSLRYTTVASSTVLVSFQPLFVVAGGYLVFRERITGRQALGAGLAIAGAAVIGGGDFRVAGALLGDILALAGAITVAGYILIGRGLRQRVSILTYALAVYGASAAVLVLAGLVAGISLYPYPVSDYLLFAALALVPTILGHTVFNWALKYLPAAVVSVCVLGEPVGATVLAYFLLREAPSFWQGIGGLMILTGLALFLCSRRKVVAG